MSCPPKTFQATNSFCKDLIKNIEARKKKGKRKEKRLREPQRAPLKQMVLDEIALEGLEGITLSSLWAYLCHNYKCSQLSEDVQNKVWEFIKSRSKDLTFYHLPESRPTINIIDRYGELDPIFGLPIVKPDKFEPRYKFNMIDKDGVIGSCEFYEQRKRIKSSLIKKLSLQEVVERWADKFIIVGSQELRWKALVPATVTRPEDLTTFQYGILEAVGRSRFNGETTCGTWSLLRFCKDSSLLFYVKNKLASLNLVLQQNYLEKHSDRITPSCLITLPRFFKPHKTRLMNLIQYLVKELRLTKDFQMSVNELRAHLSEEHNKVFKKISTLPIFRQHFDLHASTSPDATNVKADKQALIISLRNPELPADEIFRLEETEDEDDEIDWDDHFNTYEHAHADMPIREEFYQCVESFGHRGCSHADICLYLGLPHLTVRMMEKTFIDEGLIKTYSIDIGRQRLNMYVTVNNDKEAQRLKEETEEVQNLKCSDEPNIPKVTDELMSDVEFIHGVIKVHTGNSDSLPKDVYTHRLLKRKALVIEAINGKCIMQVPDIRVYIQKHEKSCGFTDELCQKSIWRLLYNMQQSNLIQLYDIFLKYNENIRTYRYAAHPKIEIGHDVLKHEMIKLKNALYLILEEKKSSTNKSPTKDIENANHSIKGKLKDLKIDKEKIKERLKPRIKKEKGKELDVSKDSVKDVGEGEELKSPEEKKPKPVPKTVKFPKLLISRHIHELLHYLVYDLEEDKKPLEITEELLYEWQSSEPDLQVKSYLEEWQNDANRPMIYRRDINWRTFIPPMANYEDKPKGWLYFLDVMKRIPLSVLNKIFRIEKEASEKVLEFLMHPVKQHYLLRQLPNTLQGVIVTRLEMQKTYIMCLKLLQNMGLLQVSIRSSVRDPLVIWVYVNRYAKILDTTTSDPGYDKVTIDREYAEKIYDFRNADEVTTYWLDLHRVCVYTKLGFKKNKPRGPTPRKKELGYLDGVEFAEAPNLDIGVIPGDGLGAGGLWSKLYAHALRHWSWIIQSDIQPVKQVRPARMPVVRSKPKISLNARRSRAHMPPKSQRRKPLLSLVTTKNIVSNSKPAIVKKSGPRDAIDRDALNNMRSLRVKWYKKEDELIKLARAVYLYIAAPVPALGLLTVGKIVRDVLRHNLGVKNKTQQACVRRSQFLIKMHRDIPEVPSWLHILQTNQFIQRKYGEDFLKRLKQDYPIRKDYCDALAVHFIIILKLLYQIIYEKSTTPSDINVPTKYTLPDSIQEYKKSFRERLPLTDEIINNHRNPKTEHDQHVSVVHGVLHSTLCCAKDKTLYNLQAFEIYKNYSEEVLQEAFTKARNDSLAIAIKRKNLQLSPTQLAGPAYLLSSKYRMRLVFLKIPYAVFDLFYGFFTKTIKDFYGPAVTKSKEYFELKSPQVGQLILIAEGLRQDFLIPFVKFPINILTLDAEYKEKCTHMDRIMDHYSSIFANAPTTEYYKHFETENHDRQSSVKFHPAFLTFNVKYSPYDVISKMPNYRVHFFCALSNLFKTIVIDILKLQHIDEETGDVIVDCPFENCIMKSPNAHQYMNTIDRLVHIKRSVLANIRKDTSTTKMFHINAEPLTLVLTPPNFLPLVRALETYWESVQAQVNLKDFGKLGDIKEKNDPCIKWLALCDDILHFKKSDDNDFCDEYEPKLSKDEKALRAQDIFVVNLPTLQFKLNSKLYGSNEDTVTFRGIKVPAKLVETDIQREKIIQGIIKESMWKYTENNLQTLKKETSYQDLLPEEKALLKDVHDMIESKKVGVTAVELKQSFPNVETVVKVLNVLKDHYLVKRVGVASFMYVHKNYVRPWVIHTFHVKRLEKEKLGGSKPSSSKRKASVIVDVDENKTEMEEPPDKKVKFEENSSEKVVGKRIRKPAKHYGHEDNDEKAKQLEKKEFQRETIVMKPRPWLRLNGSLNRRVLDRWLGAVLTECIAKTGCSLQDISLRFPQVLPIDIYSLIETLVEMKCIHLTEMEAEEVDLYSECTAIKEKLAIELYDPVNTFITAHPDAISRMAIFIGQKRYDVEFI